ncbi:hypothetical protein BSR29_08370 [Boudabousia liubingyangii]|uniref:DNA-binding protein n=1 Tax=Boudabousia liubingyangii TaxID=1921764 RepID=A0A1Q5PJD6_9ACTO|nr:hypothetical protein BSR29_08370 [Boudabousia liubingyangii]OKL47817.1 hypothetical protein BSR28_04455 [Boudabousia liubingyangii]
MSSIRARVQSGRQHDEHHDEVQREVIGAQGQSRGTIPISQVEFRERATLIGSIQSLTFSPPGASLALTATLYDGTGTIRLIWMGRAEIAGIVPGAQLVVSGVVAKLDGVATIINPRYDLLPTD